MPQGFLQLLQNQVTKKVTGQAYTVRLRVRAAEQEGRGIVCKEGNHFRTLSTILPRAEWGVRANGKDNHEYDKGYNP